MPALPELFLVGCCCFWQSALLKQLSAFRIQVASPPGQVTLLHFPALYPFLSLCNPVLFIESQRISFEALALILLILPIAIAVEFSRRQELAEMALLPFAYAFMPT
jgi:hypothetical protein